MLPDRREPVVMLYHMLDQNIRQLSSTFVDFICDDCLGHLVAFDVLRKRFQAIDFQDCFLKVLKRNLNV